MLNRRYINTGSATVLTLILLIAATLICLGLTQIVLQQRKILAINQEYVTIEQPLETVSKQLERLSVSHEAFTGLFPEARLQENSQQLSCVPEDLSHAIFLTEGAGGQLQVQSSSTSSTTVDVSPYLPETDIAVWVVISKLRLSSCDYLTDMTQNSGSRLCHSYRVKICAMKEGETQARVIEKQLVFLKSEI